MADGQRVFIAETEGSGAGKEDFYAITAHRDGPGLKIETHWHGSSHTAFSSVCDVQTLPMGFTLSPAGLRALRDAIDEHLEQGVLPNTGSSGE